MPFQRIGKNDYTSPSGRHYDLAQVRLWYANGGKFPGQKMAEESPKKRIVKALMGTKNASG